MKKFDFEEFNNFIETYNSMKSTIQNIKKEADSISSTTPEGAGNNHPVKIREKMLSDHYRFFMESQNFLLSKMNECLEDEGFTSFTFTNFNPFEEEINEKEEFDKRWDIIAFGEVQKSEIKNINDKTNMTSIMTDIFEDTAKRMAEFKGHQARIDNSLESAIADSSRIFEAVLEIDKKEKEEMKERKSYSVPWEGSDKIIEKAKSEFESQYRVEETQLTEESDTINTLTMMMEAESAEEAEKEHEHIQEEKEANV